MGGTRNVEDIYIRVVALRDFGDAVKIGQTIDQDQGLLCRLDCIKAQL